MIDLRPLRVEDYLACVPRPDAWADLEKYTQHGVGAWDADVLIATGGVLPYWPGVGEAWFALAPGVEPRHYLGGIRLIRSYLAYLLACGGYRRIQADVLDAHQKWVRLLGFELESEMLGYGPDGSTYYRYVRFA